MGEINAETGRSLGLLNRSGCVGRGTERNHRMALIPEGKHAFSLLWMNNNGELLWGAELRISTGYPVLGHPAPCQK